MYPGAQWPEMSEKRSSPGRIAVKAGGDGSELARVMGASGSKAEGCGPPTMPMACMVATAVAYHASEATSAKGLVSVRYSSRASSVSRRKKMMATSARVMGASG